VWDAERGAIEWAIALVSFGREDRVVGETAPLMKPKRVAGESARFAQIYNDF
jgi:hypothetical protein